MIAKGNSSVLESAQCSDNSIPMKHQGQALTFLLHTNYL